MHARRNRFPTVLAAVILGLAVPCVMWPGCTLSFLGPLAADAGPNATMNVGQSLVLQGSASGGSGQYSYAWTPTTGLSSPSVAQPTFTPTTIGSRVFTLTVTDTAGGIATATVTVSVGTTSPTLRADAGPDLSATVGTPVSLQGTASGGNGQYIYAWAAPAGVTLAGASTATPLFNPTTAGTFTFTLTVTDTEGSTAADTMSVIVSAAETTLTSLTWGANASAGGYHVLAVFSQALARSSAETTTNYRLTGTTTTPTTASLSTDRRTVTLVFNVALASTAQFDLSVGDRLMDAGGNGIPQISGRTPDRNTADTTAPTVVSRTWGAVISGGYQVIIVFSEVLDKTSAQTAGAYRINGTTTLAQSATLDATGTTVTVVFTGVTLTSTSRIDISVGDTIKDINGNVLTVQLNQAVSGTIATPTTVSSAAWGANFAGGGYQVLVTFSQALSTTSATVASNYRITGTTTNPSSATLSGDGKTVTLVFNVALATTDKVDVSVGSALKDSNGIAVAEKIGQTIAAATGDTTLPTVGSATWAANFASGGYQIIVVYSEAMDRATLQTTTNWRINGGTTTPSTVVLGTDGKTATLLFLAPLAITDKLDISVGGTIRDINGNVQAQSLAQAIAAAADATAPTVPAATPSAVSWAAHFGTGAGYQVLVAFNEALDKTSAETKANYQINPGAAAPTAAVLQTDGKTVALVFAGPRNIGDTLTISIGNTVKDINGNAAAAIAGRAIVANTTDATGPNITSRVWRTGQTTYQALVTFSDAMDPVTAAVAGSYSMTVNGGAAINPTTATLAADGITVTLDFGNLAVFKTGELLSVTAAVLNINGRANTSTAAVAMTATGGTRLAATSYVWVAPPTSYGITLTFPEVLDLTSATTAANYTLNGVIPTAAPVINANGRIVTLAWATGAFAVTDPLAITANVHNIAGQSKVESPLAVTQNADLTGPSIVSRTWGANQTSYQAIVVFNHALDRTSAETPGNYNLGGTLASGATLATDGKSVVVTWTNAALNAADTLTVAAGVVNINGRANTSVAAAALAVNAADIAGPTPQTAVRVNATTVDVTFNEVLDKASAQAAAYTITGGGTVTAAVLQSTGATPGRRVRLTIGVIDPTGQTVAVPVTITDVNNRPVPAVTNIAVTG